MNYQTSYYTIRTNLYDCVKLIINTNHTRILHWGSGTTRGYSILMNNDKYQTNYVYMCICVCVCMYIYIYIYYRKRDMRAYMNMQYMLYMSCYSTD